MIAFSPSNTVRFGSLIPITGGKLIHMDKTPERPLHNYDIKPFMSNLAASINLPIIEQPRPNGWVNTKKQIVGTLKAMDPDFQQDPQVLAAVDWRGGGEQWKLYLITGKKDIEAYIANFTKAMQDQMTTLLQQAIQGKTADPDYRLPNHLKLPEMQTHDAQAKAIDLLKSTTTELPGIRVVIKDGCLGWRLERIEPNA